MPVPVPVTVSVNATVAVNVNVTVTVTVCDCDCDCDCGYAIVRTSSFTSIRDAIDKVMVHYRKPFALMIPLKNSG